ncbi:hypothetical protein ACF09L_13695 [Streptomyces sp. NPDC014779]|uniref:hypothetical protein n=1 Tax=unclassified Streptomyces TaxID=2593676 RepID=UPI0036F9739E
MDEETFLSACFDAYEERLRAVAREALGPHGDVDGALAEARGRIGEDGAGVEAWLSTLVAHTCARRLAPEGAGPRRAGDGDPARERTLVDVFLTALRARDPRALSAVLDPAVVARSPQDTVRGAPAVAEAAAAAFARPAGRHVRPALVGGALGAVALTEGRPVSAVAFTLRAGRIAALDITLGEERVRRLGLVFPDW